MPFLGKTPTVGNFILLDAITVSNTATFALTKDTLDYYPGSAQNMIVSVNGVTQAPLTAYTITDSNIIFSSALDSDTDVIDYILVLGDTLNIGRPSDSTVGATQLQDYAVTSVKMSNTGVGAATYGTSTSIPQITIDAAGRITSATGIDRSNQFEDLTVTGNLTVSGNTVTVDAQTLDVDDPLIHLASNNDTTDVVDIGFVGNYSNDGSTVLNTGFFRDASDEQYYLFNGLEGDLSSATTIDRTANTFTLADLNTGKINATVDSNIAATFSSTTTTAKITLADANDTAFIDINASRIGIGHASSTSLQALQIEPTSAEAMRIDSSGRVGIGTTSPDSILHLSGSSSAKIIIEDSVNPRGNYIGLNSSDNIVIAADEDNIGSSSTIRFRVDATERMRIDSSGRLLIGTSSSRETSGGGRQLQIEGTNGVTSSVSITRNQNGIYGPSLTLGKSRSAAVGGSDTVVDGDTLGQVMFAGADGTDLNTVGASIKSNVEGTPASNDMPANLIFSVNSGSASESEAMRISANGQVKIGGTTNSPVNVPVVLFGTGNASKIYNTGHTGLHINNENATAGSGNYGAGISFGRFASNSDDQSAAIVPVQTKTDQDHMGIAFFTHDTNTRANPLKEKMRITGAGNVGIGTDNPSNKLNVDVNTAAAAVDSISIQNRGVTTVGHTTGLRFQFDSAVPAAIRAELRNTSSGVGELNFYTSSDGTAANLAEHLSIKQDGIIEQQGLQKKVYTVPSPGSGVTRVWEIIDPSLSSRQFGIITLLCGRSGLRQQRVYHRYYFNSSDYDNAAAMTTIETPLTAGFSTCSVTYSNNKIYLTLTGSTNAITDAFRVIIEGVFVDYLDPTTYTQT